MIDDQVKINSYSQLFVILNRLPRCYLSRNSGFLPPRSGVLMARRLLLQTLFFHRRSLCIICVVASRCKLSTKPRTLTMSLIYGISRWETTELVVSFNTPMEVIEQLKQRIQAYITANSREWSDCALNIDKMDFQNDLCLIVAIERKPAFSRVILSICNSLQ